MTVEVFKYGVTPRRILTNYFDVCIQKIISDKNYYLIINNLIFIYG